MSTVFYSHLIKYYEIYRTVQLKKVAEEYHSNKQNINRSSIPEMFPNIYLFFFGEKRSSYFSLFCLKKTAVFLLDQSRFSYIRFLSLRFLISIFFEHVEWLLVYFVQLTK